MDQGFLLSLPLLTVLLCSIVWLYSKKISKALPLPPGPRPLPIIGNLLNMPTTYQWLTFDKWIKQYGDIVYVEALGNKIIILGSAQRANDILEKRSALYSDRVQLPMLDLMGWKSMVENPSSTFNEHFRANAVPKYQPVQLRETRALLRRLLNKPQDFMYHVRHTISAIIMQCVYGIQVRESDDIYIETAEEAMDSLAQAGVPGAFLVDLLPILRYVPPWVPGAGFQRKAARWRSVLAALVDRPFKVVKQGLSKGTAVPSVAATLLQQLTDGDHRAEHEIIAKNCAGVAYTGGADTSASAVQSFFLAMAMYPEVQKKAQKELDAVVGCERLPDFSDRNALPYINAVVKETLRWQPVTPLGVAHYSTRDDEYDGFFIPKGSIVIGNSWSILHDPKMYAEPEVFRPERFLMNGGLNPEVQDPSAAAFGFGRRICPGRHLSSNTIYVIVSSVLSVFDIEPPRDELGHAIQLQPKMSSGLLSYPLPFRCTITPRSDVAAALIRDSDEAVAHMHSTGNY